VAAYTRAVREKGGEVANVTSNNKGLKKRGERETRLRISRIKSGTEGSQACHLLTSRRNQINQQKEEKESGKKGKTPWRDGYEGGKSLHRPVPSNRQKMQRRFALSKDVSAQERVGSQKARWFEITKSCKIGPKRSSEGKT